MLHQSHWTGPFGNREREEPRTVITGCARVFLEAANQVIFAQVHITISACQIQVDEIVPIWVFSSIIGGARRDHCAVPRSAGWHLDVCIVRSEEHTSELQSLR